MFTGEVSSRSQLYCQRDMRLDQSMHSSSEAPCIAARAAVPDPVPLVGRWGRLVREGRPWIGFCVIENAQGTQKSHAPHVLGILLKVIAEHTLSI